MKKHKYKNSGYSSGGASNSNNTIKTWQPRHYSAVSDLDANLNILRNRSFDLAINSPIGAAAINTMLNGTISTGLKIFPTPDFKTLNISAENVREWSRRTQTLFNQWANSLDCDFNRRNNFFELQRIAFISYLADGDCFCLFKRRKDSAYTLKLQLIEAARVSNPLTNGALINSVEMLKGNGRIVNGVEVDAGGRLTAIHISNKIWNEPFTGTPELKWQRVKMFGENGFRNVLHICYDTRPDMFRGAPLLAPVIESLKQVARYSDAELTASIIKSFFALFFVQSNTDFNLNQILPQEEFNLNEYKLGAGTLNKLPIGVDVKSVESGNSQSNFAPYVDYFVKMIGAALRIPGEVLMANFQSSYSASRAALIAAESEFKNRRASFVNDFCQPIYEAWLMEAVARGIIDAPGFFDNDFIRNSWSAADFRVEVSPSIDELKQVSAAEKRIMLGISSRHIECTKLGNDYDIVSEELKQETENLTN